MGNNFHEISLLFEIFYDCLSRLVAFHTCIFSAFFVDRSIIVHHIDFFQIMTFSYFKIIRVMCRSDLHRSCSELFVYIIIRYDRNLSVYKRKDHVFADNILISLIIGMYRDRRIAKKSLRTRCRNLKETICSYNRIFNMPKMSFLLFMLYLCI